MPYFSVICAYRSQYSHLMRRNAKQIRWRRIAHKCRLATHCRMQASSATRADNRKPCRCGGGGASLKKFHCRTFAHSTTHSNWHRLRRSDRTLRRTWPATLSTALRSCRLFRQAALRQAAQRQPTMCRMPRKPPLCNCTRSRRQPHKQLKQPLRLLMALDRLQLCQQTDEQGKCFNNALRALSNKENQLSFTGIRQHRHPQRKT